MKEIDKDHYCQIGEEPEKSCEELYCAVTWEDGEPCETNEDGEFICSPKCKYWRRKWETPEQRKERTGEELRDDAPVYVKYEYHRPDDVRIELMNYGFVPKMAELDWKVLWVIIATADWGKPPE